MADNILKTTVTVDLAASTDNETPPVVIEPGSDFYCPFGSVCYRIFPQDVWEVYVSAGNIEPQHHQQFLFNEQTRQELLNSAIDEIRERYGFMALMPADTLELQRKYRMDNHGYILHNPALTR